MIFNVGYLTGITGSPIEYLIKGSRFILPSFTQKKKAANALVGLIEKIKPDILFLAEVRDEAYLNPIKKLFTESHIDSKYKPGSFLNYLPFFRGNCNGVFLRSKLPVTKFFMTHGSKKLVYKVGITENCSILFAHFALGKQTRSQQFSEIAQIARKEKQSIIAGDFNIFGGTGELDELLSRANLRLVNNPTKKTFPSYQPSHVIDLFLASPSVITSHIEVLGHTLISDHLPVVADLEIS